MNARPSLKTRAEWHRVCDALVARVADASGVDRMPPEAAPWARLLLAVLRQALGDLFVPDDAPRTWVEKQVEAAEYLAGAGWRMHAELLGVEPGGLLADVRRVLARTMPCSALWGPDLFGRVKGRRLAEGGPKVAGDGRGSP